MKKLFLELLVASLVFFLIKIILVVTSKALSKVFKGNDTKCKKFDIGISLVLQCVFISGWVASIGAIISKFGMTDLECYISLCMIGIFSVVWCYFSWDAERILVRPCRANANERRLKKILIYSLVLIFVLCQGYYQTLHAVNESIEVNMLFSVTNYSIVVGTIAFDRLMNQIFKE